MRPPTGTPVGGLLRCAHVRLSVGRCGVRNMDGYRDPRKYTKHSLGGSGSRDGTSLRHGHRRTRLGLLGWLRFGHRDRGARLRHGGLRSRHVSILRDRRCWRWRRHRYRCGCLWLRRSRVHGRLPSLGHRDHGGRLHGALRRLWGRSRVFRGGWIVGGCLARGRCGRFQGNRRG